MSGELIMVLVVLLGALALFVSDRVPLDLVALLVVIALPLTGVLTPQQALAGFSDPLVVMVAGLFVVSGALVETGLAGSIGNWIARVAGNGEARLIAVLMLATAGLSAFMSTTGTVAIMLPIAVRLAWRRRLSPSLLLIPVAFAALLGGTLTLIATPPNLVASQTLVNAGHAPLGFFAMAPIGVVLIVVAVVLTVTLGRRLLPARAPNAPAAHESGPQALERVAERFGLSEQLWRMKISRGSRLVGETLGELRWPEHFGVRVVAIDTDPDEIRSGHRSRRHLGISKRIGPFTLLDGGDRMLVQGTRAQVDSLAAACDLASEQVRPEDGKVVPSNLVFAELLVTPRSEWIGKTLAELRFRDRYRLVVLGIQRGDDRLVGDLAHQRLRFGDVLLVRGMPPAIDLMRRERDDAAMLSEAVDGDLPAPRAQRAPVAAVILIAMLAAMAFEWLPLAIAVLLAVVALVASGSLSVGAAYRSVRWPAVILLAGMLPLATALSETGAVEMAAGALTEWLGPAGPRVMLAGVYLLTVIVTQFLSNTTSAVLVAPIALQAATALGYAPAGMLVAVALGASCSFINPVATPVTTLVLGPGHYRFSDVARAGLPLQVLVTIVVLVMVPWLFPL